MQFSYLRTGGKAGGPLRGPRSVIIIGDRNLLKLRDSNLILVTFLKGFKVRLITILKPIQKLSHRRLNMGSNVG